MKKWLSIIMILCVFLAFSSQKAFATSELIEAAKKEGKAVLYSSLPVWANDKLCKAFEKKYSIKAEY